MKVEHQKPLKVDELAQVIPREAGATWSLLWQLFYDTRMLKYVHKRQFPRIKTNFNKICTHEKLQILCKLGYFRNPQRDIYTATNKVLPILKAAGFNTELLPAEADGKGDINEINNTGVFVKLMKSEHFYTLLYPHFGYIIPDALLVEMNDDEKIYKLTFIEVERNKPNWEEYIEKKRDNYLLLSKDKIVFNYWKEICNKLNIKPPAIDEFCFTVSFYGSIKKDFGYGFRFIHTVPGIS